MSIEELIRKKIERLSEVPDKFVNSLVKTEREFYQRLLKLISELETVQGNFVLSKANLAKAAEIENQLKNIFLETDFKTQVKTFLKEFDEQAVLNAKYFQKTFPGAEVPEIAKALLAKKKETTAKLLLGDNLDANFIEPLRAQVDLAVTSQSSFTQTLDAIQRIVTGDSEVDSKIAQYAKQVAYDSFAVSDRAYTKVISDELGADWFKYSGGVIDSSREFCIERHNQYFHRKEIEAWGEGEKTTGMKLPKADGTWPGKMEGTNSETIFVTCGGHRCYHSALPVSIAIVPQDVIERAISQGFYEEVEK